jgi:hypothetical protein
MNFHNVTQEDVARVVEGMGLEAFLELASKLPEVGVKYGDQKLGLFEFLLNQLDSDEWEAVKRGERRISTEKILRLLIDHVGRGIPAHLGLTSEVRDGKAQCRIIQPTRNYDEIVSGYVEAFFDFPELKFLSASEFEDKAEAKKEKLLADGLISDLIRRAYMPIPTPYFIIGDYGKALQKIFLPALMKMYKKYFPAHSFNNYRDGDLEKKVSIIEGTDYDKFMMASGPDVVWYFPMALLGFSINASREAMKIFTKHSLALSGAISTSLAITGNVKEMAESISTPCYNCAAVSWESTDYSLGFGATDDKLWFDWVDSLGDTNSCYSAGLIFFG